MKLPQEIGSLLWRTLVARMRRNDFLRADPVTDRARTYFPGRIGDMPYVPYWFEPFSAWTPWIVPVLALAGLWIARLCEDARVRSIAEACYFGAMIVASMITLRTILADDHCWLLHTASLGAMILGAIFPHHTMEANASDSQTWESNHWESNHWESNS